MPRRSNCWASFASGVKSHQATKLLTDQTNLLWKLTALLSVGQSGVDERPHKIATTQRSTSSKLIKRVGRLMRDSKVQRRLNAATMSLRLCHAYYSITSGRRARGWSRNSVLMRVAETANSLPRVIRRRVRRRKLVGDTPQDASVRGVHPQTLLRSSAVSRFPESLRLDNPATYVAPYVCTPAQISAWFTLDRESHTIWTSSFCFLETASLPHPTVKTTRPAARTRVSMRHRNLFVGPPTASRCRCHDGGRRCRPWWQCPT